MSSIRCLYFFPGDLFYRAVICIVPAFVHPATNIGSIVSEHRSTRMYYHCMQSVFAVILDKVWGECSFKNLKDVKGFWKGNPAIKFSSVTMAIPKPFQVHAQDTRQGEQFDTLRKKKMFNYVGSYFLGSIQNQASPVSMESLFHIVHKSSNLCPVALDAQRRRPCSLPKKGSC